MKLVAFGEIMLRLMPPGYARLEQMSSLDARFGGAEANVAVAYSRFGGEAAYVTTLPDNPLGNAAIRALRAEGVDTRGVNRGGPRIGTYYVERGAAQRPSVVVYDRAGSSVSLADPATYDWDTLLAGADWFFFTGITPALGEPCQKAVADAIKAAHRLGVRVACDINYRAKLWSYEEAGRVMRALCHGVDYLIVNEEHAEKVLGTPSALDPAAKGKPVEIELPARRRASEVMAKQLMETYGLSGVAMTLRTTLSAEETMTGSVYYDGKAAYHSPDYRMRAVDRVGSGDAYTGGLLYGLSAGMTPDKANRFAAASCALKHSVEGDFQMVSRAEVERLCEQQNSRIER